MQQTAADPRPESTMSPAAESAWCRTFPALPEQTRQARQFIAGILNGHPASETAIACVSELASNAITHSRSAHPGGAFRVRLRRSGAAIRVEVSDQGGPWGTPPGDEEHGRGLRIVRELASRCDITLEGPDHANPDRRIIWFEIF
jgi:serine/threonine-protein kinase RsbW